MSSLRRWVARLGRLLREAYPPIRAEDIVGSKPQPSGLEELIDSSTILDYQAHRGFIGSFRAPALTHPASASVFGSVPRQRDIHWRDD